MKKTTTLIIATLLSVVGFAQDIATARSQGVGATVTIIGVVTSGDELGPIRYLEDVTAGIAIYDISTNNYLAGVVRGDSISITGDLVDWNGLMELNPNAIATIHSSNNNFPTPQIITPIQIGELTESELVQIDNVIFNSGGSIFTVGTHDFTASGETGKIYIRAGGHPLENSLIPMGAVTLVGISSQYISPAAPTLPGYQILPRDSADIIQTGALIFTSAVVQSNITTSSFDLSWTVSDSSTTNCNYGLNNALGTAINNGGNTLTHTMNLTGLQAATFYYVECYSVNGIDTAFSNVGIYSTASNSTGVIRPYFNHSVDISVSTGVDAQNITTAFNDTIKAYMDSAQNTLDICVYNASDATIATAINDAYNRGVTVRYIADDDVVNSMLSSLNSNIPIVYRDPALAGIMHNKFIIVDANSTNNSWVMGGSTNWTNPTNLFNDYNNLIFIQDEAIAKAYTLEFEEMWAGTFGANKLDNTPHKFVVGGKDVEVYFSPSDQTTSHILEIIDNVDYSFEFGLLGFTRDDLGLAVIAKNGEFGVNVRGIIEQENITGSEFADLIAAGVNVKSHMGITYSFHHKYAIADANITASDPTILTGSHNWSNNAENNSDENTLVIHDATIANIYLQEFTERFNELGTSGIDELIQLDITIFPNPSAGKVKVKSDVVIQQINLYAVDGKLLNTTEESVIQIKTKGIYFIKIITEKGIAVKKIVIE
jgi:hypothetical protein